MGKTYAYRIEVPEVIAKNPEQAIIDGFTILYNRYGMKGVEEVLEAVLYTVYPNAQQS